MLVTAILLQAKDLRTSFFTTEGELRAVDGNFDYSPRLLFGR